MHTLLSRLHWTLVALGILFFAGNPVQAQTPCVVDWDASGQRYVPPDLMNAVAIDAGQYHTLALRTDGTVVTWGYGPTNIPAGLINVAAIAAGDYYNLILLSNGTAVAWGSYWDGSKTSEMFVPAGLSISWPLQREPITAWRCWQMAG